MAAVPLMLLDQTMRILMLSALLPLCACTSIAQVQKPALITNPSATSSAELVSAISIALGVTTVTIADDAFVADSIVFIERAPARDAEGRRLNGRELSAPEQFQLMKDGASCVLVHARTTQRMALKQVRCREL